MGKRKKILLSLLGVILVLAGVFLVVKPAQAIFGLATIALNAILYAIAGILAVLATLVIKLIVDFAQYNKFVNTDVVSIGWGLLRDLANMFFILMLLVIAFATVLKQEKYSYKTLLAPLLIMAVLVNFSKMICGLVIDFAQVIMLSFVNAFKDIGAGNLIAMLNMDKTFSITPKGQAWIIGDWGQVASSFIALLLSFVVLIVTGIVLVILVLRIVMLWILVVISPLAFIFYVLPGGQKYAKMWQDKFVHQVIIGPLLAFFLWLAFYAFQIGDLKAPGENLQAASIPTETGSSNVIAQFVFATAMLVAGLFAAQQLGVAGADLAGKGVGFLQRAGTAPLRALGKGVKYGAGIAKDWVVTKLGEKAPILTPSYWKGIQERFRERRAEAELRATGKGYALAESIKRMGGKEAARLASKRYEQRIIETQMRKERESWGAVGYGREHLAEMYKSALLTRGREGEIRRAAILQMASVTGNLDDIYQYAVKHKWHKDPNLMKGLTDEDREMIEKMDDEGFNTFYRGTLGLKGEYFPAWLRREKEDEVKKLASTSEIRDKATKEAEKQIETERETVEGNLKKINQEIELKVKAEIEAEVKRMEEKKEKVRVRPGETEDEARKRVAEQRVKPRVKPKIEKEYEETRRGLEERLERLETEEEKVERIDKLAIEMASDRIAIENANKAPEVDQERMRTLYAITQNVIRSGHYMQASANLIPETGKYYIMGTDERYRYAFGGMAKLKSREVLEATTPFNFCPQIYDPATGTWQWYAGLDKKSDIHIKYILNYPRDLFRDLHLWQPRNASILLGVEGWVADPFFDKMGKLYEHRRAEFEKLWKLRPDFFAHAWRTVFRGGALSGERAEVISDKPWDVER